MAPLDPSALSDEELQERRASWERDRSASWQEVATRRGSEYVHAYAAYMKRRSDSDAVLAELRQRGLIKSGFPASPPSVSRFTMEQSTERIRVWANAHVRYPAPDQARACDRLAIVSNPCTGRF